MLHITQRIDLCLLFDPPTSHSSLFCAKFFLFSVSPFQLLCGKWAVESYFSRFLLYSWLFFSSLLYSILNKEKKVEHKETMTEKESDCYQVYVSSLYISTLQVRVTVCLKTELAAWKECHSLNFTLASAHCELILLCMLSMSLPATFYHPSFVDKKFHQNKEIIDNVLSAIHSIAK